MSVVKLQGRKAEQRTPHQTTSRCASKVYAGCETCSFRIVWGSRAPGPPLDEVLPSFLPAPFPIPFLKGYCKIEKRRGDSKQLAKSVCRHALILTSKFRGKYLCIDSACMTHTITRDNKKYSKNSYCDNSYAGTEDIDDRARFDVRALDQLSFHKWIDMV